jgi:hypothetical protein
MYAYNTTEVKSMFFGGAGLGLGLGLWNPLLFHSLFFPGFWGGGLGCGWGGGLGCGW